MMRPPEQLPADSSLKDAGRKIREIISYLRSIRLTAGPGIRISQYTAGIMISGQSGTAGQGGSLPAYNGIFAVSYDAEAGNVTASSGFCYVNGYYVQCDGLTCAPGDGRVCLTVTRSSGGNSFSPGLKVVPSGEDLPDFPSGEANEELTVIYPLAVITKTGDGYTVEQLHRYNPPILTIYGTCE